MRRCFLFRRRQKFGRPGVVCPVTGGMQGGLFQNKPVLLVHGLFAVCAWLIGWDDDKIRSVDLLIRVLSRLGIDG
jgi:hypothetical protein